MLIVIKSFISTSIRGKHSGSFGLISSYNSPFGGDITPNFGIHFGYNYLIVKRAEKYNEHTYKLKTKNYIKQAFGFHVDILSENEFLLTAKYYRKMLNIKY